jgi:hypothetical protein
MHPDNTVICQVKISRAAMKAAQEGCKSCKAPAKGKKNIFFKHIKSISFNWCFFFCVFFENLLKYRISSLEHNKF